MPERVVVTQTVRETVNVEASGPLVTPAQLAAKQDSDADLTSIAALSPSNDDVIQRKSGVWVARSMAQVKIDLALAKGDVGLGNVDNTSDASKPVSTAQQAALDEKAGSGTVDTIDSVVLLTPTADDENALTIKSPSDTWGDEGTVAYGKGQAIELLREDYAGAPNGGVNQEPDKNVLFRVDRRGGVGLAGGMHVATGLRQRGDFDPSNISVWIDQYLDIIGLVIDAASDAPTQPYALFRNNTGDEQFKVDGSGRLIYHTSQVRATHSTTQSLANGGVGQALVFDTEDYDTDSMHSTSSNTDRFIATVAGVYAITVSVEFASNATGLRQLYLQKNGSGALPGGDIRTPISGAATQITFATQVKLAANDYVRAVAFQNSGGALNATAANTVFAMSYVGRGT